MWTDEWTYGWMEGQKFETHFIRSTQKSRPNNTNVNVYSALIVTIATAKFHPVEEVASKNKRISNFEGLVTLTLNQVILHTVVHHSSTFTYLPNFVEIKEIFCGRTNGWKDRHLRPTSLGRLKRVDLIIPRSMFTVIYCDHNHCKISSSSLDKSDSMTAGCQPTEQAN